MSGPRASRRSGFTLLELLVALFLAGLLVSLVAPSLSGTLESARLRSCTADVRATLALARAQAAAGARERSVTFDIDAGRYGVDGAERRPSVPDGIRIASARVGTGVAETGAVKVRFLPDGGADDAEIVLASSGGGTLRVLVDPLTGIAEAGE